MAAGQLDDLEERLAKTREEMQRAERDRGSLGARKDALELGLNRKDGAGALLAASDQVSGLLGSVAALLTVQPGFEAAVASALGSAADAVAVENADSAIAAFDHLKAEDLGRAALLLGSGPAYDVSGWPALPDGAAYALDVVSCPDGVRPALARLLDRVAVVDDLATARALVAGNSELTAVTKDGDLLGAHVAAGGSASQPSLIEIQAAVDEASAQLSEAVAATERLGFDLSRLERERHEAQKRVDVALAKLHESDATLAAVAEELGQYGAQSRAARGESERLERSIAEAQAARTKDMEGLEELEARLARAEEDPDAEQEVSDDREQLAEAARASRQAEMESRLALRTAEERSRALHGRADQLLRAAQEERETRARELERRRRLVREGEAAQAVAVAVGYVLERLDVSIGRAAAARAEVEQARKGREEALLAVRSQLRDLNRAHDELVNSVHRDEMARQQQKMRIDQLQERALEELGMDADVLIAEYGPDQLVPPIQTAEPGTVRRG